MPASASVAIRLFRSEQRLLSRGAMMPLVWQAMHDEWQRRLDRATARSIYRLGHEGVAADFRAACQRR